MSKEIGQQEVSGWGKIAKIIGIILSICCIAFTAVIVMERGKAIERSIRQQKEQEKENVDYTMFLSQYMVSQYSAYLKIAQERDGKNLNPADVYFTLPEDIVKVDDRNDSYGPYYEINGEYYVYDSQDDVSYVHPKEDDLSRYSNDVSDLNWYLSEAETFVNIGAIDYWIKDNKSGFETGYRTPSLLSKGMNGEKISEEIKDNYPIAILIRYDNQGVPNVLDYSGVSQALLYEIVNDSSLSRRFPEQVVNSIKNVDFLLVVEPGANTAMEEYYGGWYADESYIFAHRRFGYVGVLAVAAMVLLAVVLMTCKMLGVRNGWITRLPIEISSILALCLLFSYIAMAYFTYYYSAGEMQSLINEFYHVIGLDQTCQNADGILCFLLWCLYLFSILIVAISLLQIFRKGFKRYFKENCICCWIGSSLVRRMRSGIASFKKIDFSNSLTKKTILIVGMNAIAVAIMCCLWFFGIGLAIIYSIVLFILGIKYIRKVQAEYNKVLTLTKELAKGNLNVEVREEFGHFESIKTELLHVKEGFAHAVEEEVKSQNMKTELISNVSHDLKTPLTAIITYIDLLKEESLEEEQRKEYIETLERKSQRLKQLIEDLFEVSKLNSNNVQLDLIDVDLVSLIKQVQYEQEERLQQQSIELVNRFPEDKLMMKLDSQKTYRIFENLYGNIIKYAMQHTRAYVEIQKNDSHVQVIMKNISHQVLELDGELLMERFVRGDKSRNTEGSGLGLAIVKSLVEKQGGSFEIIIDGDLFKTVVCFPLSLYVTAKEEEITRN